MDAYTIKKMLPRLVLAVIAVNLSWYICVALVQITNAIGGSIESILVAPFSGLNTDVLGTLSITQSAVVGGGLVLGFAGVLLFSSFAIFTPVIIGGLIALFVGYISLIGRQILIVMFTILSPLIIALWVLPGTSKTASKTISLYIKLLLMYPLVIALLVSGRIFSAISNNVSGGDGGDLLPKVVALVALFAPYFMIPFVLKFVGGALASISGMINDRTRGMLDLKRKAAHEKAMANRAATMSGRRFDDGRMFGLGKHANTVGSYVARPGMLLNRASGGRMGVAARGEFIRSAETGRIEALETLQKNGVLDHDVGNEMAVHWGTNGSARKRINQLRAQASAAAAAGDQDTAQKRNALASRLERVQDLTGERWQLAGMDMANSFGKLDDRSLLALNDIYGNDERGKAMKALALGRLREQGKGKGNFTTFAAWQDSEGFVHSYASDYEVDNDGKVVTDAKGKAVRTGNWQVDQKSADKLAVALQDAGPGILGQTKQYESVIDDGSSVMDTKAAHMSAVAKVAAGDTSLIDKTKMHDEDGAYIGTVGDLRTSDPARYNEEVKRRQRKAMEQFVLSSQAGGYNDTNTKVAADRAKAAYIDGNAESQALYDEVQSEMLMRGRMGGVDPDTGQPVPIGYAPVGAGGGRAPAGQQRPGDVTAGVAGLAGSRPPQRPPGAPVGGDGPDDTGTPGA